MKSMTSTFHSWLPFTTILASQISKRQLFVYFSFIFWWFFYVANSVLIKSPHQSHVLFCHHGLGWLWIRSLRDKLYLSSLSLWPSVCQTWASIYQWSWCRGIFPDLRFKFHSMGIVFQSSRPPLHTQKAVSVKDWFWGWNRGFAVSTIWPWDISHLSVWCLFVHHQWWRPLWTGWESD